MIENLNPPLEDRKEKNVYSWEGMKDLKRNDEISIFEEAFMQGYENARNF